MSDHAIVVTLLSGLVLTLLWLGACLGAALSRIRQLRLDVDFLRDEAKGDWQHNSSMRLHHSARLSRVETRLKRLGPVLEKLEPLL